MPNNIIQIKSSIECYRNKRERETVRYILCPTSDLFSESSSDVSIFDHTQKAPSTNTGMHRLNRKMIVDVGEHKAILVEYIFNVNSRS
jgi:hypothetical protein